MKRLMTRFFYRGKSVKTAKQIIAWWEWRRISINIVHAILVFCFYTRVYELDLEVEKATGQAYGIPDSPLGALVGIATGFVLMNLFYAFGWVAELISRRLFKKSSGLFGDTVFISIFLSSVVFTLYWGFLNINQRLLMLHH